MTGPVKCHAVGPNVALLRSHTHTRTEKTLGLVLFGTKQSLTSNKLPGQWGSKAEERRAMHSGECVWEGAAERAEPWQASWWVGNVCRGTGALMKMTGKRPNLSLLCLCLSLFFTFSFSLSLFHSLSFQPAIRAAICLRLAPHSPPCWFNCRKWAQRRDYYLTPDRTRRGNTFVEKFCFGLTSLFMHVSLTVCQDRKSTRLNSSHL